MTILCPECGFSKEVDLSSGRFRVTCLKCKKEFTVEGSDGFIIKQEEKVVDPPVEQVDQITPHESFACPECGNAISIKEEICPHCGYPLATEPKQGAPSQQEKICSDNLCRECGNPVADVMTIKCPSCGIGAPLAERENLKADVASGELDKSSSGLVVAGYVCIAVGFFMFGLILTPIGFVVGIINARSGRVGHGVVQICLSMLSFLLCLLALLGWLVLSDL